VPTTTESEKLPRPRQVTLAAALVMGASGMLVVSVFERLGNLRSVESRSDIENFISQPPGSDLGLGIEAVLDILYAVSMVAAGLATAAAILGFYVLKRNRSARVALSVLAVPLFVCGLVTGGFLASVVAASVAMLWLTPARHWFAGTTPEPLPSPASDAPRPHATPPTSVPPSPLPPPGPSASQLPPPAWPSYAATQPPPWVAAAAPPPRRPTAVVAACAITWVCCGFAALMSLLLVGVLAADADGLLAEMHRQNPSIADQGVSDGALQSASWATGIVCLVWAIASGLLAVLTFRRRRWAAIALVVSAAAVALFCLAGSLLSPPLVVPGILAVATAGLLLQSSAQRWLNRRDESAVRRADASGPGMMR
jgi:hypothetical protein